MGSTDTSSQELHPLAKAFPAADRVSSVHSPHFLLTGWELSFDKHAVLEFGSYIQTHEEHSNGMEPQTMGAICLGPMGNAQGGHWFFSLTSGCHVVHHCWTALPMPQEVILCMSQIGCAQGMSSRVTYANRWGDEISDHLEDCFDDDDARSSESDDDTYMENSSHQYSEDDETTVSNDETTSSEDDETTISNNETTSSDDDDDDDPQGNPHLPANEMYDPAVPDPAGSLTPVDPDDKGDEGHDDANRPVDTNIPPIDGIEGSLGEIDKCEGECKSDISSNTTSSEVIDECKGECESDVSSSATSSEVSPSSSRLLKQPARLQQIHMTMHDRTQTTVNDAFPLGRESPHATQHCNTWSQSSCGIPSIDMKWRRI